ncbi:hypothetical protein Pmani_028076 [Petrolisthes manimaculis]|uniref:Uncharacterized protein n=1 Tax=Petrolisthes manimaculis TaxID=1843537 RepID=A0AAE1P0T1_9EUCA|nr:hypothetical protein Pmani_028076 [Petrolisthes manimaculis]
MYVRDLQPGNTYTVDLVFISHPNQTTLVSSTRPTTFSTLPEEDPSARDTEGGGEDYYCPAMVAVAIIAAIACAAFLGILVILLRKKQKSEKSKH